MTKTELDNVESWLAAARAALPLCKNRIAFEERIREQEQRRDAIEDSLADQWAASNGIDVVRAS